MPRRKPNDSAPQGTYSATTISKILKVSEPYVLELSSKNIIPKAHDPVTGKPIPGRYELIPAVHGYIDYLRDQAFGRNAEGTKWREARTRVMLAEAKQRELELARAQGELLKVDDVLEIVGAILGPLSGRLHAFRGVATQRLLASGIVERDHGNEVYGIVDVLVCRIISELRHDGREAISELGRKREAVARVTGNGESEPVE